MTYLFTLIHFKNIFAHFFKKTSPNFVYSAKKVTFFTNKEDI